MLDRASLLLSSNPGAREKLYDGTFKIRCPIPTGYKPRMNLYATGLSARFNAQGMIFEISETSEGLSGGWMASCIPPPMYKVFLSAWIKSQENLPPEQFQLF